MLMRSVSISVVIPSCGRPDFLNRCLDALSRQTLHASQYEIIIVDERPDTGTKRVILSRAKQMWDRGIDLIYVVNDGTYGSAAARNCGWRVARGLIIAFTDDDTMPDPQWLENGLRAFDDTVDALWGKIEIPIPAKPTDYECDAHQLEAAEFVTANCFCRKDVLELLNGFDERFRSAWREGSDLHFRLLGLKSKVVYLPQAVVVCPVGTAPWGVSIFQQKKIVFDALLYKKHPRLYREKIRATPRWDFYAIVAALLTVLIGLAFGHLLLALFFGAIWLSMTIHFFLTRLCGTAKTFSHITEMAVTSVLIPPHAVFWRIVGASRFHVLFV